MELTMLLAKIIGPVLLLRALSIVIDRAHFVAMLDGLDHEIRTISFSFFPIALTMTCIALAVVHSDSSSVAGILIYVIAWGGILKGSALILFPHVLVTKARVLQQAGFLNVVLVVCFVVGGYFTWFGYIR
jgi:hypothetical protein